MAKVPEYVQGLLRRVDEIDRAQIRLADERAKIAEFLGGLGFPIDEYPSTQLTVVESDLDPVPEYNKALPLETRSIAAVVESVLRESPAWWTPSAMNNHLEERQVTYKVADLPSAVRSALFQLRKRGAAYDDGEGQTRHSKWRNHQAEGPTTGVGPTDQKGAPA